MFVTFFVLQLSFHSSDFPSSRLELEAVADIFDIDKDGFIAYKEFLATLKPHTSNQPNLERIRDEVQRQVSLCKCSKRYHVTQISNASYRVMSRLLFSFYNSNLYVLT